MRFETPVGCPETWSEATPRQMRWLAGPPTESRNSNPQRRQEPLRLQLQSARPWALAFALAAEQPLWVVVCPCDNAPILPNNRAQWCRASDVRLLTERRTRHPLEHAR